MEKFQSKEEEENYIDDLLPNYIVSQIKKYNNYMSCDYSNLSFKTIEPIKISVQKLKKFKEQLKEIAELNLTIDMHEAMNEEISYMFNVINTRFNEIEHVLDKLPDDIIAIQNNMKYGVSYSSTSIASSNQYYYYINPNNSMSGFSLHTSRYIFAFLETIKRKERILREDILTIIRKHSIYVFKYLIELDQSMYSFKIMHNMKQDFINEALKSYPNIINTYDSTGEIVQAITFNKYCINHLTEDKFKKILSEKTIYRYFPILTQKHNEIAVDYFLHLAIEYKKYDIPYGLFEKKHWTYLKLYITAGS